MKKILKIGYTGLVIAFIALFSLTGCATARKNPWQKKRAKASQINSSQLGRNKYYFSVGYQKKLSKSIRK